MQHEKTAKMAVEWLSHLQAEIAYSSAQNPSNGAADDKPAETKTN